MSDRILSDRIVLIRLSSLGDVILSMAALDALPAGKTAEWITIPAYAGLFEGHPRVSRVWTYDRKQGLRGWLSLLREADLLGATHVFDLHGSLRTRLAHGVTRFRGLLAGRKGPTWRSTSKQRLRRWGYFSFKALWPAGWRPSRVALLHEQLVARAFPGTRVRGGQPSLAHFLAALPVRAGVSQEPRLRVAVMPDSLWTAKKWPVEKFVELFRRTGWEAWVLGTSRDTASAQLLQELARLGLPHRSLIGVPSFRELAQTVADADAFLGCDTGMAHFAEALGVRAWIVYGPTTPDMGFGPWKAESVSAGSKLWCRPCGKDGRYCFRTGGARFACMSGLGPEQVLRQLGAHV